MVLTDLSREVARLVKDASGSLEEEIDVEAEVAEAEFMGEVLEDEGFERPVRHGEARDPEGFLTNAGVTELVEHSSQNTDQSQVVGLIRIFRTRKQRTWFAVTRSRIFCVLDDSRTSAGGREVRWATPLALAEPVVVRPRSSKGTGLVDVGQRRNWLYSQRVYPDPEQLQTAIRRMIGAASRA